MVEKIEVRRTRGVSFVKVRLQPNPLGTGRNGSIGSELRPSPRRDNQGFRSELSRRSLQLKGAIAPVREYFAVRVSLDTGGLSCFPQMRIEIIPGNAERGR